MTYQWNFGDGIVSSPTAAPTVTHSYTRHGDFTAVVTATGGLGSLAATTQVVVRPYLIYLPLLSRQ
jgi:PKD repeat protein